MQINACSGAASISSIQVADYNRFEAGRGFYLRFEQTSDSLLITSVYRNKWHEDYGGDVLLTEMNDSLRSCGINHLNEHFAKEVMTGGKMQLKSKTLRLRFRKFLKKPSMHAAPGLFCSMLGFLLLPF
ncbi:MAG: lipocalin-like domain-containing protein [Segatella copri]